MLHREALGDQRQAEQHGNSYIRLLAMTVLSFVAMYVLMYAMVDKLADVYPNWNQAYMAALMTAPMVLFELLLMRPMYPSRRLNSLILGASLVLLVLSWFAIRYQWGVEDRQFLRSMVPHHSGAILMCREAEISDTEIKALCRTIMDGQQREIDQMNAKLSALQ
jgi:hypothetical protein